LRDARRNRIESPSEEEIMRDYIDLKIRAFINVSEAEIDGFYRNNINEFFGKNYDYVREEIEKYLTEKDLNERLRELLKELRKNAYIKIQLN
jgi:hypothetical protein